MLRANDAQSCECEVAVIEDGAWVVLGLRAAGVGVRLAPSQARALARALESAARACDSRNHREVEV